MHDLQQSVERIFLTLLQFFHNYIFLLLEEKLIYLGKNVVKLIIHLYKFFVSSPNESCDLHRDVYLCRSSRLRNGDNIAKARKQQTERGKSRTIFANLVFNRRWYIGTLNERRECDAR